MTRSTRWAHVLSEVHLYRHGPCSDLPLRKGEAPLHCMVCSVPVVAMSHTQCLNMPVIDPPNSVHSAISLAVQTRGSLLIRAAENGVHTPVVKGLQIKFECLSTPHTSRLNQSITSSDPPLATAHPHISVVLAYAERFQTPIKPGCCDSTAVHCWCFSLPRPRLPFDDSLRRPR